MDFLAATFSASLLIALVVPTAGSSNDGFNIDVEMEEVARLDGDFLMLDLTVGDTGKIDSDYICISEKGNVLIDALAPVSTTSKDYWLVRMLPGKKVSMSLIDDSKEASAKELRRELVSIVSWLSCEAYKVSWLDGGHEFFEVSSIQGTYTMSELLSKIAGDD